MPKQLANPFYVLLLVVGVAFALTACCYGIMMVHQSDPQQLAESPPREGGLVHFMDRHGFTLLMWELGALAVFTFAAIGADDYWMRKAAARLAQEDESTNNPADDKPSPAVTPQQGASP